MKIPYTLILSALLCSTSLQAATYFTWVDDQGITHYSATPPNGISSEPVDNIRIHPNIGTLSPQPANGESITETEPNKAEQATDADASKEKSDKEFAKELADAEVSREENCATARNNKIQLTLKNRIKLLTEEGTYRMLSEEEKQQEIRMADEAIETFCN